jgi:hypothetical protein
MRTILLLLFGGTSRHSTSFTAVFNLIEAGHARQIEIWRPISTTCSPGRLKKSVT